MKSFLMGFVTLWSLLIALIYGASFLNSEENQLMALAVAVSLPLSFLLGKLYYE
jgi:hypothetical protein